MPERAHAADFLGAGGATIEVPGSQFAPGQRESMAAFFVGNAEVTAGFHPFRPVRGDSPPARAMLGEQMREFVTQGALHLVIADLAQPGVEGDQGARDERRAGGAAHPRIPAHNHALREFVAVQGAQEFAGLRFEAGVTVRVRWYLRLFERGRSFAAGED